MTEIRETLRFGSTDLEEMNRVMGRLQDRLDELEGRRGTPAFKSNVDMEGNRITDVGTSSANSDAITKSELDGVSATVTASTDSLQTLIDDLSTRMDTSVWPIGSIFISVISTNPATLLGFGTWVAFGAGKFLVGLNGGDVDFNLAEKTGGAKSKNLAHTHTLSAHVHTIDHTHPAGTGSAVGNAIDSTFAGNSGGPNPDATGSGGSATQDIIPPYIVCYFWKRTA